MKDNSYKDEKLRQMLSDLPKIKDEEDKEELYKKISPHIGKRKRQFSGWVVPSIATAAVLMIVAIVIPVILSSINQEGLRNLTTQEPLTDAPMENAEMEAGSEEMQQTPSAEQVEPEEELKRETGKESSLSRESNSEELHTEDVASLRHFVAQTQKEGVISTVLPGRNGEVVVPLTLVPAGEQDISEEEWMSSLKPESWGLTKSPITELNIEVNQSGSTVTFPDNFSVSGSAWGKMIIRCIQWKLYSYQVDTIHLRTESNSSVQLGNYGTIDQIPPVEKGRYIYQLYQTSDSQPKYLVPVEVETHTTLKDAFNQLNKDQSLLHVSPAVPEHISFVSVTEEGRKLTVQLKHGVWENDQQIVTTIESILMTAKQFGFQEVMIKNSGVQNVGGYQLDQPIQVPAHINPLPIAP